MKQVVAVAGGGISGLSLAWGLLRRGIDVRVFEPDPRPGGKLGSERIDGFLVEGGPQSFRFRDGAARAAVAELGLEDQLVEASPSARRRCVAVGDRLREVPDSPEAFARTDSFVGPVAKARLLAELTLPRGPAGRGEEESVAAFGRRRFGRRGAERLFFPLVSGLYAGDPEVLSLPAAFPLFAQLERERRSVLRGAWRALAEAGDLASFREGMATLPRAFARKLGDRLELGATVRRIRPAGAGWRVAVSRGPVEGEQDQEQEVGCDAVVLALPAHAAGAILEELDPGLAAAVGRIPYAPVAMVHLRYRAADLERLPHAYGFYTPSGEPSRLLGAVFTSRLFPGHAPAGSALVACRLGGPREPRLLEAPDGELAALAHRELERLAGARGRPVFEKVVRHPRALPQYTLGHTERVASIEAATRRHPGLFLAGNAYRGLGILDCLRQGEALALRIATHLSWPFLPGPGNRRADVNNALAPRAEGR